MVVSDALTKSDVDFASFQNVANDKISKKTYDVILLNFSFINEEGGKTTLEKIRSSKNNSKTSLFFLFDPMELNSKANAINMGAVDCFEKPLNRFELQQKIANLQLDIEAEKFDKKTNFEMESVLIDFVRQKILYINRDGFEIQYKLTPTEFRIFCFLYENSNELISREKIFFEIWKSKLTNTNQRIVDKHLATLRNKICQNIIKIEAIHGHGYKMTIDKSLCQVLKS